MLWPEDSPAKTSAVQAKARDSSKASGRACGLRCLGWSASASQLTSSLRTRRCSVHGDSTLSSKDLPASGLMRRGTLYPQATSVRPTSESECGFSLPTPTVCGNYNRKGASKTSGDGLATWVAKFPTPTASLGGFNRSPGGKMRPTLEMMARHQLWPTPTVQAAHNNGAPSQMRRNALPLNAVVKMWPTPTADDANNVTRESGSFPSLTREARKASGGGKLSPRFVEWLMGWPIGWVSLDALATDRFQLWRQQRFDYSASD